jgi:hypothetical protein
LDAKTRREKLCGTDATSDAIAGVFHADPAKALVMTYVRRLVVDGFDRCLWGTDWTRAFAVVNYEQAVEHFLKADRLSDTERATLMGGACAKAYSTTL